MKSLKAAIQSAVPTTFAAWFLYSAHHRRRHQSLLQSDIKAVWYQRAPEHQRTFHNSLNADESLLTTLDVLSKKIIENTFPGSANNCVIKGRNQDGVSRQGQRVSEHHGRVRIIFMVLFPELRSRVHQQPAPPVYRPGCTQCDEEV